MADVFKEVDEEVRKEKLAALWKKIGPFVIGGALLIVATVAGRIYWDNYQLNQRAQESERYQEALELLDRGQDDQALAIFTDLAENAAWGYDRLSHLQRASILAEAGQTEDALREYQRIASDTGYEDRYRDFASLMAAVILMDQGQGDDAEARLQELAGSDSPWRYSGSEMLGLLYYRDGRFRDAVRVFNDLSQEPDAPPPLKNRVQQLRAMAESQLPPELLGADETNETLAEPDSNVAQGEDQKE